MKITACVNVSDKQITQEWDSEDNHLIIQRFESQAIGIPLDESRIKFMGKGDELAKKIPNTPPQLEHLEALVDSLGLAYLGTLSLSDAIIFHLKSA